MHLRKCICSLKKFNNGKFTSTLESSQWTVKTLHEVLDWWFDPITWVRSIPSSTPLTLNIIEIKERRCIQNWAESVALPSPSEEEDNLIEIIRRSADLGPYREVNYTYSLRLSHSLLYLLLGFWIAMHPHWIAIQLRQAGLERQQDTPRGEQSYQLEGTPLFSCSAISELIIERGKGGLCTFRIITKTLFSVDVGHAIVRGWGANWGGQKKEEGMRDSHEFFLYTKSQ